MRAPKSLLISLMDLLYLPFVQRKQAAALLSVRHTAFAMETVGNLNYSEKCLTSFQVIIHLHMALNVNRSWTSWGIFPFLLFPARHHSFMAASNCTSPIAQSCFKSVFFKVQHKWFKNKTLLYVHLNHNPTPADA